MTSNTKRLLLTFLLTVLSVVVAAALILAGVLLGMDPGVERVVRDFFGLEDTSSDVQLDSDLQEEIFRKLEATYYKEIDPDILQVGAIDGMLASLGDPYTVYYDPEEYAAFQEETSGSYSGVGMQVQMSDRLVTVVSVFEGSPAASADIQAGDIVISVDGISSEGRTIDEVVSDIKGPEGTSVVLQMYRPVRSPTTVTTAVAQTADSSFEQTGDGTEDLIVDLERLPAGGTTTTHTVVRRAIAIPTTYTETLDADGMKVAHIVLYTFNNLNASDELRREVEEAVETDKVDAIILDLRGNGGGLLDEAVKVAGIFIENGVIVSTEGLHSAREVFDSQGDAFEEIELYVLTNEYTASASEIVAGALQDYGRAVVVGDTTFGKGLVQSIEVLSNKGAVKVTTAVYLTPKGRDINQTGITPDVVAPDDPATEEVDETVEKTLDLIAAGSANE
jgi:carboxyl-terminal processing protease